VLWNKRSHDALTVRPGVEELSMKQESMISNRGIGYESSWLRMVLTDSQRSPRGVAPTRSENSRPIAVALGIVGDDPRGGPSAQPEYAMIIAIWQTLTAGDRLSLS
jgi:hypothetical protein